MLESYGQSELGGFMAMGSPTDGDRALEGWVGRSLPDRLAYVAGLDEPFDELPAGEVGEVLVGHGFFPSYRNKPDRFAETTQGGVLHTGDLAVADPDGFIMVLGRTGEAASAAARGGFLRELEDALYAHPAVLHAAVVDRGDGELAGFYEARSGHAVTPEELIAHSNRAGRAAAVHHDRVGGHAPHLQRQGRPSGPGPPRRRRRLTPGPWAAMARNATGA